MSPLTRSQKSSFPPGDEALMFMYTLQNTKIYGDCTKYIAYSNYVLSEAVDTKTNTEIRYFELLNTAVLTKLCSQRTASFLFQSLCQQRPVQRIKQWMDQTLIAHSRQSKIMLLHIKLMHLLHQANKLTGLVDTGILYGKNTTTFWISSRWGINEGYLRTFLRICASVACVRNEFECRR